MSLNGLDNAAVLGAYQSALAEGGGWYAALFSLPSPQTANE